MHNKFMFEIIKTLVKRAAEANVKVVIKPHVWKNRRLIYWYLLLKYFYRKNNVTLCDGSVEYLMNKSFLVVGFYSGLFNLSNSLGINSISCIDNLTAPEEILPNNNQYNISVNNQYEFNNVLNKFIL